jgi:hypothetical protein
VKARWRDGSSGGSSAMEPINDEDYMSNDLTRNLRENLKKKG